MSQKAVTALRSRLVAHLTGLSASQLQYWHVTSLQEAHGEPGKRGVPRLYSWVDYRRLCVISSLLDQQVPTKRIRIATAYLDCLFPGWHEFGVRRVDKRLPNSPASVHVAVRTPSMELLADAGGQLTMGEIERELDEATEPLRQTMAVLEELGPLFRLRAYADAVVMDPELNVGLPTVVGTRLETKFIAGMVEDYDGSVETVARIYRMAPRLVARALEFEEAAA